VREPLIGTVIEGNCVTARRGGEQSEVNRQSVDCPIRSRGDSLERIIGDLNPMLRGWFGYFKHATPALYGVLDGFVRRRLRAILRKQVKRPGIGRCEADHRRWPNAFFAARGLFTLRTAFEQARHSR
jgi:RNA-directed DNA polymerase